MYVGCLEILHILHRVPEYGCQNILYILYIHALTLHTWNILCILHRVSEYGCQNILNILHRVPEYIGYSDTLHVYTVRPCAHPTYLEDIHRMPECPIRHATEYQIHMRSPYIPEDVNRGPEYFYVTLPQNTKNTCASPAHLKEKHRVPEYLYFST